MSARTGVPPLLNATTQNRNALALPLPSEAPTPLVLIDSADVTATQTGSPCEVVESRNGMRIGSDGVGSAPELVLTATVRRLEPVVATSPRLIGSVNPYGGLVD